MRRIQALITAQGNNMEIHETKTTDLRWNEVVLEQRVVIVKTWKTEDGLPKAEQYSEWRKI
jgi:hypothetical protein